MAFNSISSSTTPLNSLLTTSPNDGDDPTDMKRVLTFALPSACAAILLVLIGLVTVFRRQHVLERWSSKKQMKNTDPDRIERPVLRRDSEFESTEEGFVTVTVINGMNQPTGEPEFRVATIT